MAGKGGCNERAADRPAGRDSARQYDRTVPELPDLIDEGKGVERAGVAAGIIRDARGDVHTDTGGYARSLRVFDDQRGVGAETTDFAGHIIEWGSSRQSPQAPLRHAADAAGRFEER